MKLFYKKKYSIKGLFLVVVLLFASCKNITTEEQVLLNIKCSNKNQELEKVLLHYKNDSLKLSAAYFLIANMDNKYSSKMSLEDSYRKEIYQCSTIEDPFYADISSSKVSLFLDSINLKYKRNAFTSESDLETISADLLINNIDLAFNKWNSYTYKKDYSMDDFFRWVLPYRIGYERLEKWRGSAIKSSNLKHAKNILTTLPALYNVGMSKCLIAASFSDINTMRWGTCDQLSKYDLFLKRANGIPSAIDCVPVWANRSGRHVWNVTLLPKGKIEVEKLSNSASKVYRSSFEVQRDEVLYKYRESESIPAFFSNFDLIDVTTQYMASTSTVTIDDLKKTDSKLVWLSTFDNFAWFPVAYAEKVRNHAVFKDMGQGNVPDENARTKYISSGKGIIYLPTFYKNKKIIPASFPIILKQDGVIKTLKIDTIKKQSLSLLRKYPKQESFEQDEQNLIGARFECANRADFKDAETIIDINRKQKYCLENFKINPGKKYRYFRFIKRDSFVNIAEINFFNSVFKLKGKPINNKSNIIRYPISNVFDGKLETYCEMKGKSNVWVGIDFGKPEWVTNIAYSSRTDDNEICIGDTYQLYYWNNKWIAMDRKIAKKHVLQWENLPINTLYLLRNLSGGVEQRIFTYEMGKQIWW